jgi:hypothetical protein
MFGAHEVCWDRLPNDIQEKDLNDQTEEQALAAEARPVLVFCASDFFRVRRKEAQYLDGFLRFGPPKCHMFVLLDPSDTGVSCLPGGLMWRKLFARVVVDVFVGDCDYLPKIFHVDFPHFRSLVEAHMTEDARDEQTAVVWSRDRAFGQRFEMQKVDMPECD